MTKSIEMKVFIISFFDITASKTLMLNFLSSNPSIKGLLVIVMCLDEMTGLLSSFYLPTFSSLVNRMMELALFHHFLSHPLTSIFLPLTQKVFTMNISHKLNNQDSKYLLLWYRVLHLQFKAPNKMAFLSWFYTVLQ